MTLLLLFQPAAASEEEIIIVVEPEIIDPIPLELVRIIPAAMDVGDQPAHMVKWY